MNLNTLIFFFFFYLFSSSFFLLLLSIVSVKLDLDTILRWPAKFEVRLSIGAELKSENDFSGTINL